MNDVRIRAVRALTEALVRVGGKSAIGPEGYAVSVEANLITPLVSSVRESFSGAAGSELRGKMRAPYSSSALAVNAFSPWLEHLDRLEIAGTRGFTTVAFERLCPTGLRGTPPHLDVIAEGPQRIVAVESKCLEYLTPKAADFADAYDRIIDARSSSRWLDSVRTKDARLRHLDVAQLVKHYLGLSREYPDRNLTLLYLYWEPRNWQSVPECVAHRAEIAAFTAAVSDDPFRFESLSYPALWSRWEQQFGRPDWLKTHVARLRQRYDVSL
jgi:hypothetical protein